MKSMSKMFKTLLGGGFVLLCSLVIISDAGAQTCVPPPPGLISWWPGDDNANDIMDSNNGILLNGATFAAGKVGQAFSFTGGMSQVVVADSSNLDITTAVTLDAWVNPNPGSLAGCPQNHCAVVAKGNWPASRNYGLWIRGDGGIGTGYVTTGGASIFAHTAGGLVPEGSFTHVAAVLNPAAGEMRIHVNGVSHPVSISGGSSSSPLLDNNEPLGIGFSDPGGFQHNFYGIIDEVEVFNRALSVAEIQAISNAASAGKCKERPVGGSVTGVTPSRVVCINVTRKQTVQIQDGATSWNCEAAGLIVNPGDKILQTVLGQAD